MARASNTGSNAGGKDPSNSKVRGYNPSFEDATNFSTHCRRQNLLDCFSTTSLQVYAGQPVHQAQGAEGISSWSGRLYLTYGNALGNVAKRQKSRTTACNRVA